MSDSENQKPFKRKRLFYDIETSPNIALVWRTGYRLSVPPENLIEERGIICISYKWEGGEVKTLTWDKNQCDKKMLTKFIKIMNKADELVAHNGDKFDVKWIKGRCLYHRIPVPQKFTTIDTCTQARKQFGLNSNKLDYIAGYLGLGHKLEHGGFKLWREVVLHKSRTAMATMVEYCERDVELLEQVFNVMKPYLDIKHNYAVMTGGGRFACPECGNTKVKVHKTRYLPSGVVKRGMLCKSKACGRHFTISNKAYMELLIARREGKA